MSWARVLEVGDEVYANNWKLTGCIKKYFAISFISDTPMVILSPIAQYYYWYSIPIYYELLVFVERGIPGRLRQPVSVTLSLYTCRHTHVFIYLSPYTCRHAPDIIHLLPYILVNNWLEIYNCFTFVIGHMAYSAVLGAVRRMQTLFWLVMVIVISIALIVLFPTVYGLPRLKHLFSTSNNHLRLKILGVAVVTALGPLLLFKIFPAKFKSSDICIVLLL